MLLRVVLRYVGVGGAGISSTRQPLPKTHVHTLSLINFLGCTPGHTPFRHLTFLSALLQAHTLLCPSLPEAPTLLPAINL